MKDYRSLEHKIRDMYEANGTPERRKIENVGRPDDEMPTSDKSKLAKQGEIKTKIIDEEESVEEGYAKGYKSPMDKIEKAKPGISSRIDQHVKDLEDLDKKYQEIVNRDKKKDVKESVPDSWEDNSPEKRKATVKKLLKVNKSQGAKIQEAMKQDTPAKQDGDMEEMDAKVIKGGKTEVDLNPKTDDRAEDTSTEDKDGKKAHRAANKTIGQKGAGKLKEMFSAAELSYIMSIVEAERKEPSFGAAKKDAFSGPSSSSPSSFLNPMPGMGSQAGSKGTLGPAGRPAGVGGGKSGVKVEPTFGPAAPRLGGADSSVRIPASNTPSGAVPAGQAIKATGAVLGITAAGKLGADAINGKLGSAGGDSSAKDAPKETPKSTSKADDQPVSKSVSTRSGDSGSTTVYQTPKKTNESTNLRGNPMSSERTIFGIPESVISEVSKFGQAFRDARAAAAAAGKDPSSEKFKFGGKEYTTKMKDEPKAKSAPKAAAPAAEPAKPIKAPDAVRNDSPLSGDKSTSGDTPMKNVPTIPGAITPKSDSLDKPKNPYGDLSGVPKNPYGDLSGVPKPDNKPKFTNRAEETEVTDPMIENALRAISSMARGRKDSGILEASSSDPDFGAPRPGGEKKPGDIQFKPGPDSNNRGSAVTKTPEKTVPLPPKRPAGLGEELKGKQHKIDANKNGKIDADDFKKLRKEEVESIDEQQVVFTGSPKHTAKKAEEHKKMGYKVVSLKKHTSGSFGDNSEKHTYKMTKEEVEALDEVLDSRDDKIRYINKASDNKNKLKKTLNKVQWNMKMNDDPNQAQKILRKSIDNRSTGIDRVAKKLMTKEEVEFSDAEIARIEEIAKGL